MLRRSIGFLALASSVIACVSDDSSVTPVKPDSGACTFCDAGAPDATIGASDASDAELDSPADATSDVLDATSDVLDAADAKSDVFVPTPNPDFVWYVLDETSGTTAHDSSSHHFDITNLTGVTWNAGARFDGTGGGGSTAVDTSYRLPPMTMTAWLTPAARADSTSTVGALTPYPPNAVSGDVPGAFGFGIGINVWTDANGGSALAAEDVDTCTQLGLCVANSTQNAADAGLGCTSAATCNQGFVADTEYFVAVSIAGPADGGTTAQARVFVNGVLFDDTTAVTPPASAASALHLGTHNDDTSYGTKRFFDGRIRDVRIYQRALEPTEIVQMHTNGPALKAPPVPDAGSSDAGGSDANTQ